ncbi:MAG TPA: RHS repeat-associated core domain-containing protein, partial [Planctomycetota bacterium]|nr:RHS repeat-associated core domain-containing protein [Planctomycetota bacterium]
LGGPGTGFLPERYDGSQLSVVSTDPIVYTRTLVDGSSEVYGLSDGSTGFPRRVFLTQKSDSAGNTVTLRYDGQGRLITVTDALGQVTTFSYQNPNALLVTQVTDPFGRSATIGYDDSGRLNSITDVLGITSQFTYDPNGLVNSMSSHCGTTTFTYGSAMMDGGAWSRYVTATDPLGQTERLELQTGNGDGTGGVVPFSDDPATVPSGNAFGGIGTFNMWLNMRNTFYWDKHAYAVAYAPSPASPDYTQALLKHWCHSSDNENVMSSTLESIKKPLENRIWYNYSGQFFSAFEGTLNAPSAIGRVLDDGTTQLSLFQYTANGNVASATDALGRTTLYSYDPNQMDLLSIQQVTPDGPVTVATFTYNAQHRPLTLTDAAGQTTTLTYNGAGQILSVTDPLGSATTYQYDGNGYLQAITGGNGVPVASYSYDSYGRTATATDSEGFTVAYAYDALDRVTQISYPDGTSRGIAWSGLDLVSVTDRLGRVTSYGYDVLHRLTSVTDPSGNVVPRSYWENDVLQSLIDPSGNVVRWSIDVQGRMTAKIYPDGRQSTMTYENTTSRLYSVTDPLGQVKTYAYAPDDRLTSMSYSNATTPTPGVSFSWDPVYPRVASMTDGSGTTSYTYGPPGQAGAQLLVQEQGPFAGVSYQYDALGRLSSRMVDSATEGFGYDAIGRLSSHSGPLGSFSFGYLGQSPQLASVVEAGGAVASVWNYDTNANDRRLTSITHAGATRSYQLASAPEGLIQGVSEQAPQGSPWAPNQWSYAHDANDRLVGATLGTGASFGFTYDPEGNVTAKYAPQGTGTALAWTAAYNGNNQVQSLAGQTFQYDSNGNLISDGARTYSWDAENRLLAIGYPGGQQTTFTYDGLGRRVSVTSVQGVTTRYLWSGGNIVQSRDGSDSVLRSYYPEGELILGSGSRLFYCTDNLGSVRDVLSVGDGTTVSSYDYEPYGAVVQSAQAIPTDYRFAGMFLEPDSGLYLTPHRAYDPGTGRWLSRDPIEEAGGINLYGYVAGDPIDLVDPDGLHWTDWVPDILLSPTVVNFSAGVGDGLTMGGTNLVRDTFGWNGGVDQGSTAYSAGWWSGTGLGAATGAGLAEAGANSGRGAFALYRFTGGGAQRATSAGYSIWETGTGLGRAINWGANAMPGARAALDRTGVFRFVCGRFAGRLGRQSGRTGQPIPVFAQNVGDKIYVGSKALLDELLNALRNGGSVIFK